MVFSDERMGQIAECCHARGEECSYGERLEKLMLKYEYRPFWESSSNGWYFPHGGPNQTGSYRGRYEQIRGNYTCFYINDLRDVELT